MFCGRSSLMRCRYGRMGAEIPGRRSAVATATALPAAVSIRSRSRFNAWASTRSSAV